MDAVIDRCEAKFGFRPKVVTWRETPHHHVTSAPVCIVSRLNPRSLSLRRGGGLGVQVIEDCAHALGAEYKGRRVGSHGHLSVFSLQVPTT